MALKTPNMTKKPSDLGSVAEAKAAAKAKTSVISMERKPDTEMVMAASQYSPEDEFAGLYMSSASPKSIFIQPPFPPKVLKDMPTHNNTLLQCVEAMEVNIDGTGYEFVAAEDGGKPDEEEMKRAKGFFEEPFPGLNFIKLRRELRRDLESVGWGVLEVLRNVAGELVGLRNMPAISVRFVRLDDQIPVTKTVMRDGKEEKITVFMRERRFAQMLNQKTKRYYKEYGASRKLNAKTGDWVKEGDVVEPQDLATELLLFTVITDSKSPYGIPRWINQLPSVIGSRKAEEQNLDFFDAGTLPPTIIFVEGGEASQGTSGALRAYLSGQNKNKQRAVVVDIVPSSGNLDSTGKTSVKVERFGSENMKDAMWSLYDTSSSERVRGGFRLPPLFLGKAADYNLATAQVSYMVAEAQVFKPERDSFDATINSTVMRELKCKKTKYRSLPVTLKDVEKMLAGVELVLDKVETEGAVAEVNKIVGTNLKFDTEKEKIATETAKLAAQPPPAPVIAAPGAKPGQAPAKKVPAAGAGEKPKPTAKKVLKMATDYIEAEGLPTSTGGLVDDVVRDTIRKEIDDLDPNDRDLFNKFVAARVTAVTVA